MARIRLAVALLLPDEVTREVDGMRRGLGVDTGYIPPHITVVPPLNVAADQVEAAVDLLRDAATEARSPLRLTIGGPDTFLPSNPVTYLTVTGELDRLGALRRRCLTGVLQRDERHPFVPHVTLTRGLAPTDDATIRRLLAAYRVDVEVDRVHLLVQVTGSPRGRHWAPIADLVFSPRHVVGVGGFELELTTSTLADPPVRRFVAANLPDPVTIGGDGGFVVAARVDGGVIGVAWGRVSRWAAVLDGVIVEPGRRHQGVGSQVLALVEHHATRSGATVIEASTDRTQDGERLLLARGWTDRDGPGGARLWRALAPDSRPALS